MLSGGDVHRSASISLSEALFTRDTAEPTWQRQRGSSAEHWRRGQGSETQEGTGWQTARPSGATTRAYDGPSAELAGSIRSLMIKDGKGRHRIPHTKGNVRDVLLREIALGLRQSLSSGTFGAGGPMSPLPRTLPSLLPGPSDGGALGWNFAPRTQVSSASAREGGASSRVDDRFANRGGLGPRTGPREAARQSEVCSETDGGSGSRSREPGVLSYCLRDPSREGRSGRGPSRRQGLSNFSSSMPPLKPERSFASDTSV